VNAGTPVRSTLLVFNTAYPKISALQEVEAPALVKHRHCTFSQCMHRLTPEHVRELAISQHGFHFIMIWTSASSSTAAVRPCPFSRDRVKGASTHTQWREGGSRWMMIQ
jgi:hypothetical protein